MKCEDGHTVEQMVDKFIEKLPKGASVESIDLHTCPICGSPVVLEGNEITKKKTKKVELKDDEENGDDSEKEKEQEE